jgi:hypothetical protein
MGHSKAASSALAIAKAKAAVEAEAKAAVEAEAEAAVEAEAEAGVEAEAEAALEEALKSGEQSKFSLTPTSIPQTSAALKEVVKAEELMMIDATAAHKVTPSRTQLRFIYRP